MTSSEGKDTSEKRRIVEDVGRQEVGDGAIDRSLKTFQLGNVQKRKPFG